MPAIVPAIETLSIDHRTAKLFVLTGPENAILQCHGGFVRIENRVFRGDNFMDLGDEPDSAFFFQFMSMPDKGLRDVIFESDDVLPLMVFDDVGYEVDNYKPHEGKEIIGHCFGRVVVEAHSIKFLDRKPKWTAAEEVAA
jgi:hypothetical protein